MNKFIFWAMASHGEGISGGDRIYIEFAKRWSQKYPLKIVTWREGMDMMARNNLFPNKQISFLEITLPKILQPNLLLSYLSRIILGVINAININIDDPRNKVLYSASEFWMDSLPCFILKLRYPSLKWIASWYQTAPSPLKGFSQGRHKLTALLLWLSQLPIRPLVTHLADYVLINNDLEKAVFPRSRTIVVLGAVNTIPVDDYRQSHRKTNKYAAVFQGRFHPQKGVVELIEIWRLVVNKYPDAKLAMIGDGPLRPEVKLKVNKLNLQKNVSFFGFIFDGPKKYQIFSQSQIVVHPAFFDSGGMAAAEAMAFGIPAVGFDLPAFGSYYPVGMVKVPTGNLNAFVDAIVDLLKNSKLRNSLGRKAEKFIRQSYSWDYRSSQILQQIVERTNLEKDKAVLQ